MTADLQKKLELVRAAIERVKAAEIRRHAVEAAPSAGSDDRAAAWNCLAAAERRFAWQWRNVEALLDGLTQSQSVEVKPRA